MAQLIFNEVVSEVDFITWDLTNSFGVTMRDSIQTIDSGRFLTSSFLKLSLLHFIAVSRRCSIRHFCLPSCENCLFFKYVYLSLLFDMKHNVFNWPNIFANEAGVFIRLENIFHTVCKTQTEWHNDYFSCFNNMWSKAAFEKNEHFYRPDFLIRSVCFNSAAVTFVSPKKSNL